LNVSGHGGKVAKRTGLSGSSRALVFLVFVVVFQVVAFAAPVSVDKISGLPAGDILAIASDGRNAWLGTSSGVVLISGSDRSTRTYGTRDGLPEGRILSIALFKEKVYAGTESGLSVFDGRAWKTLPGQGRFSLSNAFLRAEPGGGWLWVAAISANGGLFRFDGERWEFLGGEGRGPLNNVRAIAFEDNTAWLGTLGSGVYQRTASGIRYFKTRDGLPAPTVSSIETYGGTAWAGTGRGLARFGNGRWAPVPGSPVSSVTAMAGSADALFLAGPEGLFRYSSGSFQPISLGEFPEDARAVTALAYSGGTLYAGTPGGLLVLKGL
jgi:ligand-binding sensor domain-containing protein